jgi:hypothetical protein
LGAHRFEPRCAVVLLRIVFRQSTSTLNAFGLALVSAGALGNALDRIRLGAVVDLFNASKLGFVWIFNVADVSIDLGIGLFKASKGRAQHGLTAVAFWQPRGRSFARRPAGYHRRITRRGLGTLATHQGMRGRGVLLASFIGYNLAS